MKCIICSLPIKEHTITQLKQCHEIRRTKINMSIHAMLRDSERNKLEESLTNQTKEKDNANR